MSKPNWKIQTLFKMFTVILLLVFFVMPSRAFDNGHELYEASMVTREMAENSATEGNIHEFSLLIQFANYVDGFIGGLQFAKTFDNDLIDVCIPKGEPLTAALDAVRTYATLLSRADALNTDARMIVYLSLSARYSCN